MKFKNNKFKAKKIVIKEDNTPAKASKVVKVDYWMLATIILSVISSTIFYIWTNYIVGAIIVLLLSFLILSIFNPKRRYERIARLLISFLIGANYFGFKVNGEVKSDVLNIKFDINPPSILFNTIICLLILFCLILDYKSREKENTMQN